MRTIAMVLSILIFHGVSYGECGTDTECLDECAEEHPTWVEDDCESYTFCTWPDADRFALYGECLARHEAKAEWVEECRVIACLKEGGE